MRKYALPTAVAVLFLCAGVRAADSYRAWKADNADTYEKIAKILKNHPNFRDAFAEAQADNPGIFRDYIEFLSEKGDRNTGDFTDKFGGEAKSIKHLHETYPDQVKAFREIVRDHPASTKALFKDKATFKTLVLDSQGKLPEERGEGDKKGKKKKKDD
jgi:hypothetical protein